MPRRLILLLLLLLSLPAKGEPSLVVVVRQDSHIGSLNRSQVIGYFLGGARHAGECEALDQLADADVFYEKLTGRTRAQIKAYWARLLFTGRTRPPRTLDGRQQLLDELLNDPQTIGYLRAERLDRRLRVVFELPP
ncbi:MAG: hypothetical protein F9K30_14710 [Dechloromonas sp.]|nr:MAG: hypothetical protein F9K30_14710 [Dechloromonas sp.]